MFLYNKFNKNSGKRKHVIALKQPIDIEIIQMFIKSFLAFLYWFFDIKEDKLGRRKVDNAEEKKPGKNSIGIA